MLSTRIIQLTIPSSDDGEEFIRTDRLDLIRKTLEHSKYECFADLPLAKIYCHRDFRADKAIVLVSCHIDSLYSKFSATLKDGELRGTFDNSACNAIAVEGMLINLFPAQVLISFTGDEENDSKGVDQTIRSLQERAVFANLEIIITLDLTEEHYQTCHFTIENYFVEQNNGNSLLRFLKKREIKTYLAEMIDSPVFVKDAEPDESWQYDEYNLNCFSLCLPCRLLGHDMHSDIGVAISENSLDGYMNALKHLTHNIDRDLANKAFQR